MNPTHKHNSSFEHAKPLSEEHPEESRFEYQTFEKKSLAFYQGHRLEARIKGTLK